MPIRPDTTHADLIEEFDRVTMTTPEKAAKVIHDGVTIQLSAAWFKVRVACPL